MFYVHQISPDGKRDNKALHVSISKKSATNFVEKHEAQEPDIQLEIVEERTIYTSTMTPHPVAHQKRDHGDFNQRRK